AQDVIARISDIAERFDARNLHPGILDGVAGQFGRAETLRQPALDLIVAIDQQATQGHEGTFRHRAALVSCAPQPIVVPSACGRITIVVGWERLAGGGEPIRKLLSFRSIPSSRLGSPAELSRSWRNTLPAESIHKRTATR